MGIEAHELTKRFGRGSALTRLAARAGRLTPIAALMDVSFTVSAGEVVALVGPNGSGKSTLLRILATLIVPDGGRANVDGHDVVRDEVAVRRRVALVTADDRSFSLRLTGRENLAFFALARGLMVEPAVLLLDEPFRALDDASAGALRAAIGSSAAQGASVLVATHHVDELGGVCGRVLALEAGALVYDGPLAGLAGR